MVWQIVRWRLRLLRVWINLPPNCSLADCGLLLGICFLCTLLRWACHPTQRPRHVLPQHRLFWVFFVTICNAGHLRQPRANPHSTPQSVLPVPAWDDRRWRVRGLPEPSDSWAKTHFRSLLPWLSGRVDPGGVIEDAFADCLCWLPLADCRYMLGEIVECTMYIYIYIYRFRV